VHPVNAIKARPQSGPVRAETGRGPTCPLPISNFCRAVSLLKELPARRVRLAAKKRKGTRMSPTYFGKVISKHAAFLHSDSFQCLPHEPATRSSPALEKICIAYDSSPHGRDVLHHLCCISRANQLNVRSEACAFAVTTIGSPRVMIIMCSNCTPRLTSFENSVHPSSAPPLENCTISCITGAAPDHEAATRLAIRMSGLPKPLTSGSSPTTWKPTFR
jgi:hypothetical protein